MLLNSISPGVYNLLDVMTYYRVFNTSEGPYYLLPYTILMYFLNKAASFEVLYVALINFGLGACGACLFLLGMGLYSSFTGRTPYEEKKRKKNKMIRNLDAEVKDEDDFSPWEHFEQVFGTCGWIHFLIPWVPFEMPKVEMGYRRIITYNNDYIMNGTIYTSEANLDYVP